MNEKVKKLWLKALRSGKYKKGKDQLKQGNNFCCLGVLCDLYGKAHNISWNEDDTFLMSEYILPSKVKDWANLDDTSPVVINNKQSACLSELNDKKYPKQMSFKTIANIIEKQL